jgi:hypothetical protein
MKAKVNALAMIIRRQGVFIVMTQIGFKSTPLLPKFKRCQVVSVTPTFTKKVKHSRLRSCDIAS